MLVVHVFAHVLPTGVDRFIEATEANIAASRNEPGIDRIELVRSEEDPNRFVIVGVYQSEQAVVAHKKTAHYATWRDAVAGLMAEPRGSMVFGGTELFGLSSGAPTESR